MESHDAYWANCGKIYKPENREEEKMLKDAGYLKIVSGLGQEWYEKR